MLEQPVRSRAARAVAERALVRVVHHYGSRPELRGTGYASQDIEVRELRSRVGGVMQHVEINVAGLAGFLLAKFAAVQSRRASKDWYDIAFVLLHNDAGMMIDHPGLDHATLAADAVLAVETFHQHLRC